MGLNPNAAGGAGLSGGGLSGGSTSSAGLTPPRRPMYSETVGSFNRGGGSGSAYGAADKAIIRRPYSQVGKQNINLLDPDASSREEQHALDVTGQASQKEGLDAYFDQPGGLFAGIGGAIGGVFGKTGSEVGSTIGKVIEAPLALLGAAPIPVPFIDEANAAIEDVTPYILRDVVNIPKTTGGLFMNVLNTFGLLGRAVERTYAGTDFRGALPEDIQARIDAGEIDRDRGLDELVMRGQGFTDDPWHNLGLAILLDPLNLMTLGVGAIGGAVRGGGKVAAAINASGRLDKLVAGMADYDKLADLAKLGRPVTVEDLAKSRGVFQAGRRMVAEGDNAMLQLGRMERLGLTTFGPLSAESNQLLVRVSNHVIRMTDPLKFFGGGNIGKRSMEHLGVAATAAVLAEHPSIGKLVRAAEASRPGSGEILTKAFGIQAANVIEQYGTREMVSESMKSSAVNYVHGPGGVVLSPTEAVRGVIKEGQGLDVGASKHLQTLVSRFKPNLAALDVAKVEADTIKKLARITGGDPVALAKSLGPITDDMAQAVHAAYYFHKGGLLNTVVKPALRAITTGLPTGIIPDRLTLVAERTLTKQRAVELTQAIKDKNIDAVRRIAAQYDAFDWIDSTMVDDAGLIDLLDNWIAERTPEGFSNLTALLDEVDLIDPATKVLRTDLPAELADWAQDLDSFGYRLALSPPLDIAPSLLYRITRDLKDPTKILNMDPWLEFQSEASKFTLPGRFGSLRSQLMRGIRQEQILATNKRRFVAHMAHGAENGGVNVPPAISLAIYRKLMFVSSKRKLQIRGIARDEYKDVVAEVLHEQKMLAGLGRESYKLTDRQVMNSILVAYRGNLRQVGVTQYVTGTLKAKAPGSAGNFWGVIAEDLYPKIRFTLNPIFQAMETTEPYILGLMRGVTLPLRRGSPNWNEGLATRNAIDQLAKSSLTPDGMVSEQAEFMNFFWRMENEAQEKFGSRSFFGRLSLGGIHTAERKAVVAGQQVKGLVGERLYETFRAMKGPDEFPKFWAEMERNALSVDRGTVAMHWLTQNLTIQDMNGNRVGKAIDLLSPQNVGQELRVTVKPTAGAQTFGDIEQYLDMHRGQQGLESRASRRAVGHGSGDTLVDDLTSGRLTLDDLTKEMEATGITMGTGVLNQAETVYRMATGKSADDFWKSVREGFTSEVTGTTPAYTRLARDEQIVHMRAMTRAHAESVGLTEDEYVKTRIDGLVRFVPTGSGAAPGTPGVLFDMRRTFARDVADAIGGSDAFGFGKNPRMPGNLVDYIDSEAFRAEQLVADQFVYVKAGLDDVMATLNLNPNNIDQFGDVIYGYTPGVANWRDFDHVSQNYSSGTYDSLVRIRRDAAPMTTKTVTINPVTGKTGLFNTHLFDVGPNVMPQLNVEYWTGSEWRSLSDIHPRGVIGEAPGSDVPMPVRAIYGADSPAGLQVASINRHDARALFSDPETAVTEDYKSNGYTYINKYLRGLGAEGNDSVTVARLDGLVADLDASIAKGMLPTKLQLYRGIKVNDGREVTIDYANMQVGDTFRDPAYMSFSSDPTTAKGMFAGGVVLEVELPPGYRVNLIEGGESEYLVGRDSDFEVIKRTETKEARFDDDYGSDDYEGSDVYGPDDYDPDYPTGYGSGVITLTLRPKSPPHLPGIKHLVTEEATGAQVAGQRLMQDAVFDPDGLVASARRKGGPDAAAAAEEAVARAEAAKPRADLSLTFKNGERYGGNVANRAQQMVANDLAAFDVDTMRTAARALTDVRERLLDIMDTTDRASLHALARTVAERGGAGLQDLLRAMENVQVGRSTGAEVVLTSTEKTALTAFIKGKGLLTGGLSPEMGTRAHDLLDALMGNTSRRVDGRGTGVQPVYVDDLAAADAGYITESVMRDIIMQRGEVVDGIATIIDDDAVVTRIRLDDMTLVENVAPTVRATIPTGELPKVDDLGGSTGANVVESPDGVRYVDKRGASEAHIREEFAVDEIYRTMGVAVTDSQLLETAGRPVKRAAFQEGTLLEEWWGSASDTERAAMRTQLQQGMALDALLANWDVIGLEGDNIIVDAAGRAVRVDNGGALRFRAMGTPKGGGFSESVSELTVLRESGNPWAVKMFKGMPDGEVRRQVLALDAQRVKLLAAAPSEVRVTLAARLDDMLAQTDGIAPAPEPAAAKPKLAYDVIGDYEHEHIVRVFNDKATEMNAQGIGGRNDWTAAEAQSISALRTEQNLGRFGGRLSGETIDQFEVRMGIATGNFPKGSGLEQYNKLLDIYAQPGNEWSLRHLSRTTSNSIWSTVRDELGLPVLRADETGIGIWGDGPQSILSLGVLATPEASRAAADVMAYVTHQAELWAFSPVARKAVNPRANVAQLVVQFSTDGASRTAIANMGKRLNKSGMSVIETQYGIAVTVTDRNADILPRLADGFVDENALPAFLEDLAQGDEIENVGFGVQYGDLHVAGPNKLPDGTPDWEGFLDATEVRLQAGGRGLPSGRLDSLRTTYREGLENQLTVGAPKQVARIKRGHHIQPGVLEDRRNGTVLGTTARDPARESYAVITAVGRADPLTGMHELMHVFAMDLSPSMRTVVQKARMDMLNTGRGDLTTRIAELDAKAQTAKTPSAATRYRNQAIALRNDMGELVDEADFGIEHEEFLVSQYMRWLRTGTLPTTQSTEMVNAFQHFRNWVEVQWNDIKGKGDTSIRVSSQMESLFSEMFSPKAVPSASYSIEQSALMMSAKQVVMAANDEAHATHFYKKDRGMLERSLNHPYIGMYPISYMWGKILPEMVRFLALRPFGMETPLLSWNIFREVSDTVRSQSELDPGFRDWLHENKQAFQLFNMLFPALPNDIPANVSLPVRRIAEQGLKQQADYEAGREPTPIDYSKGMEDAINYAFGPLGTVKTGGDVLSMGGNLAGSVTEGVREFFGVSGTPQPVGPTDPNQEPKNTYNPGM